MTDRDDIIRMAREAGLAIDTSDRMSTSRETHFWVEGCYFDIERFFWQAHDAGAAAEREKVARWMRERGCATGHGDTVEALLEELRMQEREACAKVFAAAIRARGEK